MFVSVVAKPGFETKSDRVPIRIGQSPDESNLMLVDCSNAVTRASLPGLYRLPDYATELGAPWNVRVAVVIPQTRFRMEMFQFFELVFRKAGYDLHLFDDRESAEAWLQRPPPVRTRPVQTASA